MRTRILSLLVLLGVTFAVACRKGTTPKAPRPRADIIATTPSARASTEISIGSEIGSQPGISLGINQVFRDQQPLDHAPWHTNGGDWTFLVCRLRDGGGWKLLIGVRNGKPSSKPIAWGDALLAPSDRASGTSAVEAFAKAFGQPTPRAKPSQPLEALRMRTAVLGVDLARGRDGGFGESGGHWTATKWFLQADGYEAEVYFNYNLDEGVAEFSEKDPDYDADLIAVLARVLRDGPRPERTPETDPNLQAEGPRFSEWRLLSSSGSAGQFSDDQSCVFFHEKDRSSGERLLRLPVESSGRPIEIFRTTGRIAETHSLDATANRFVILESHPTDPGVWSSEDPTDLLLVARGGATQKLIGAWGRRPSLPERSISPDRRYVAVTAWKDRTDGKQGRYQVVYIYDLSSGATRSLAGENTSWGLAGWTGSRDHPLALVSSGLPFEKGPREYRVLDPRTGAASPTAAPPAQANLRKTAPDGRHSFRLMPGARLVFEEQTRLVREFTFHEDDARFAQDGCCDWVSTRYVFFRGPRPAFIDNTTGKMSLPSAKEPDLGSLVFGADFQWVLSHRENGLWIAHVLLPESRRQLGIK